MKLYLDSIIILSKNFNFLTYINLFYYLFFYIYSLHSVKNFLVFLLKNSISHKITKIYSNNFNIKSFHLFFFYHLHLCTTQIKNTYRFIFFFTISHIFFLNI